MVSHLEALPISLEGEVFDLVVIIIMANSESPVSPTGDIATSDCSSVHKFKWDQTDLDLIQEHERYYSQMMYFIKALKKDGPTTGMRMPKKPAKDLKRLLKKPDSASSYCRAGKELY